MSPRIVGQILRTIFPITGVLLTAATRYVIKNAQTSKEVPEEKFSESTNIEGRLGDGEDAKGDGVV